MESFFKYAADIIKAAAEKPLGVFALIVLVIGVLAFLFFAKASERTRIVIFVLILVAGSAFGAVVLRAAQTESDVKARVAAIESLVASRTQVNVAPSPTPPSPPVPASAPPPPDDWNDPKWEEARTNIKWIFLDAGANRTYNDARGRGLSKYLAILAAQGHNPNAQRTIAAYGESRTDRFLRSLGQ